LISTRAFDPPTSRTSAAFELLLIDRFFQRTVPSSQSFLRPTQAYVESCNQMVHRPLIVYFPGESVLQSVLRQQILVQIGMGSARIVSKSASIIPATIIFPIPHWLRSKSGTCFSVWSFYRPARFLLVWTNGTYVRYIGLLSIFPLTPYLIMLPLGPGGITNFNPGTLSPFQ
jgi:hypothetical protein